MGYQEQCAIGAQVQLHWFCVRSHPKHEHIAAANVRSRLALEVWNPQVCFRRATRRGPATVTESVFPGYFFARFDLACHLDSVRHTTGVSSVIQFGERYPTISPITIERLKECFSDEEPLLAPEAVRVGDNLSVVSGDFAGVDVVVFRTFPGRQRVQVLLEMLGTSATVELDLKMLSFQRRYPQVLQAALLAAA